MLITRRSLLAAGAAALAAPGRLPAQGKPRPNVLFIAADDMNTALGCYGHPVVKTPNIDRLAASGVRFDRAYCQFPLCGPSRASLLTGMRPDTTQVLGNNIDFRDHLPAAVTLPQFFKDNGYFTAREGKMFHMNVPTEVTLNRFQDAPSWNHSVSPGGPEAKSEAARTWRIPPGSGVNSQWLSIQDAKGQSDVNAADRALALLDSHKQGDPFFLGLGFIRPHLPYVAPGRFFDLYPVDSIPLPQVPSDDLDDIPAAHKGVRPGLWNGAKLDAATIREARRGYYAATSFMDEQLGRVLQGLDRMGLRQNTIIVFWGDHGYSLGEHFHWLKMALTEEVARVPLIIAAPGRAGNGKSSRSLVEFVDLYPTLAELCGMRPPASLQGQSLIPLLDRPSRPFKKAAFTQIQFEQITGRSIRTARYRYTRWEGLGGGEELYDHDRDPGEFRNLAPDPSARAEVQRHAKILDAGWQAARA